MTNEGSARGESVVGVDGCAGGWVAVALVDGRFEKAARFDKLSELVSHFAEAAFVAIDIPLGPAGAAGREADAAARRFLGPGGSSSVFSTMPREVAQVPDYAEANALMKRLTGKGLSRQSYALREKIIEADGASHADPRLFEVHPEVSFHAMNHGALGYGKKTWAGFHLRRNLLFGEGIEVPPSLDSSADVVGLDDVLDAAAAAWTARRRCRCLAQVLPPLGTGGPAEPRIWY
jgi:predicted RNase H-like nuclease